ncbi:MAG: tetratricopeptide repeat protein [Chloroflexi bacterium]|nr:tetratricopeptide repeat protein [Chloroflexota bacterium]
MGRIEKTVFISYRRTNFYTALAVYQDLTQHGFDVFLDYESIDSGSFEIVIIENIKARAHFLAILSPSALERCNEPSDWFRREIECAINEKRNITPLMMEGFDFGSPTTGQALTGKLSLLKTYNGLRLVADYFFEAMEKLRTRFLNKALEDVPVHSLSDEVKEISEDKKAIADDAAPVEAHQLTAEEWFERGYIFQADKNSVEALRCYSETLRLDPNSDTAYNTYTNMGILLGGLKRYDEAEIFYHKAIELNPSYDSAYSNLGNLLGKMQRNNEAETAYRKAIQLNPSNDSAYHNLGVLLYELKHYEEAEAAYRKAIELNPSRAEAYSNLGILLYKLKRYDEAEVAYRKSIELNPSNDSAYHNLGLLLRNLKCYDEAEVASRKAIQLNPSNGVAYNNLGILLYELKRYDEAEVAYRKAIELNPSDATTYNNLGILLHELKRYDEAEAAYRKAIVDAYNNLFGSLVFRSKSGLEAFFLIMKVSMKVQTEVWKNFNARRR